MFIKKLATVGDELKKASLKDRFLTAVVKGELGKLEDRGGYCYP